MESNDRKTHKKNDVKPSEASLQRLSEDKRYFKAVANYMANVLGIDRNAITEMLAKKVDSRNVDQLVADMVCKYFGFGPNANSIGYAVDKRIGQTIDEHVRETMDRTCRGWIDRAVQLKCEEIAGRTTGNAKDGVPVQNAPGLELYQGSAYVSLGLLQKLAGDWIQENMPMPARLNYTVKLLQSGSEPAVLDIYNLKDDEADLLNPLREDPGHYRAASGACRIKSWGIKKLVADMLGWERIGRIVVDTDGMAVFPPEI